MLKKRFTLTMALAVSTLGLASVATGRKPKPDHARHTQISTTADLQWGGGPVLANVKVFVILWGNNVDPDTVTNLSGYFQTITQSPWMDVMAEYDTATQQIGRGSFEMMITDPDPLFVPTLTDADIQTEITKAIFHLGLPAPDENSVYFVVLPPTVVFQPAGADCTNLCSYHSYFQMGDQDVVYVPMPDCTRECDYGTGFENFARIASHELAESITDPNDSTGWIDNNSQAATLGLGGEIGDICEGFPDIGYTLGEPVQYIWSNQANACVVIPAPDNDFSMTATPTMVSLALGASTTIPITTTLTKGVAESLALTVSGMSNGLTASVSPTMITSGDPATLTISAAADADQARVFIDTTATHGNYSHQAEVEVTVGTPGDFSIAIQPSSQDVLGGSTTTYTVNVGVVAQPIGDVTLTPLELDPDLRATFDPPVVTPGGSSTMTISAGINAPPGQVPVQVQGAALATVHSATAKVVITVLDAGVFDAHPHFDAKVAPDQGAPAGSCAIGGQRGGGAGLFVLAAFGLLLGGLRRWRDRRDLPGASPLG